MKKILSTIITLILLVSCDSTTKPINDKLITPNRIGYINIGEKYDVLSNMQGIEIREVDLSGKRFKDNIKLRYGYKDDDNFKVYAQRQKDGVSDKVHMIICGSNKYQTANGIHVGMTIQELRKIYPNKNYELNGGINNEIGFFIPSDLVARNQYDIRLSHVILKLSTEMIPDTIISSIIVGTD